MTTAEYYEKETLLDFVKNNTPSFGDTTTMRCVERAINNAPTVDVAEVVHGEWIYNRGQAYGEPLYFCSVCISGGSEWGEDKYCPNCGAKMSRNNV